MKFPGNVEEDLEPNQNTLSACRQLKGSIIYTLGTAEDIKLKFKGQVLLLYLLLLVLLLPLLPLQLLITTTGTTCDSDCNYLRLRLRILTTANNYDCDYDYLQLWLLVTATLHGPLHMQGFVVETLEGAHLIGNFQVRFLTAKSHWRETCPLHTHLAALPSKKFDQYFEKDILFIIVEGTITMPLEITLPSPHSHWACTSYPLFAYRFCYWERVTGLIMGIQKG